MSEVLLLERKIREIDIEFPHSVSKLDMKVNLLVRAIGKIEDDLEDLKEKLTRMEIEKNG